MPCIYIVCINTTVIVISGRWLLSFGVLCRPFKSAVLFNIQGKEGEINELVKREKERKEKLCKFSADDVAARSLKRLQKMECRHQSWSFLFNNFQISQNDPEFYKVAKAVTGKSSFKAGMRNTHTTKALGK